MEQNEKAAALNILLDKLFIAKGKALMPPEHKRVWAEYLFEYQIDDLKRGIDDLIRAENPWPEVATVIKHTKKYADKREQIAWDARAKQHELEMMRPSLNIEHKGESDGH